jgi:hypothetical protein
MFDLPIPGWLPASDLYGDCRQDTRVLRIHQPTPPHLRLHVLPQLCPSLLCQASLRFMRPPRCVPWNRRPRRVSRAISKQAHLEAMCSSPQPLTPSLSRNMSRRGHLTATATTSVLPPSTRGPFHQHHRRRHHYLRPLPPSTCGPFRHRHTTRRLCDEVKACLATKEVVPDLLATFLSYFAIYNLFEFNLRRASA